MLLDRELSRESAVLELARPSLDDIALVSSLPALHDCDLFGFNYCTSGWGDSSAMPSARPFPRGWILVAMHLKTTDDLFDSRSSPTTESL
jgi:hypothetical protein